MNIRASAVPRLLRCPQSAHGETKIGEDSEPGRNGSAVHFVMAAHVDGVIEDPVKAAEMYEADPAEVTDLVARGREMWRDLVPQFPDPQVEVDLSLEVGDLTIRGRADLLAIVGQQARVLDWKTARERGRSRPQLATYALMAAKGKVTDAAITTAWIRHGIAEEEPFTAAQLDDHLGRIVRAARSEQFETGDQCRYCPRAVDCPALLARERHVVSVLRDVPDIGAAVQALIDRRELWGFYHFAGEVEKAAKDARNVVRKRVAEDGLVSQGDHEIYAIHQEMREAIPAVALPILLNRFGADAVKAVKVSIGAAEKLASAAAPRGQKGPAAKELASALEAAGAVIRRLVVKIASREV